MGEFDFGGAFGGDGSGYDLSSSSGVDGSDDFQTSGPKFGSVVIGGGSGMSVSTPVLLGAIVIAGLFFWSKK